MLKKNYTKLCYCLPQNYIEAIRKFKEVCKLPDSHYYILTEASNLMNGNTRKEAIIVLIIMEMKCDAHALIVCDYVEKIADNENSKSVVKTIRHGKT